MFVVVATLWRWQAGVWKVRTNRGYTTLSGNRLNFKGEIFAKRQVYMFTIPSAECFFVIPFITWAFFSLFLLVQSRNRGYIAGPSPPLAYRSQLAYLSRQDLSSFFPREDFSSFFHLGLASNCVAHQKNKTPPHHVDVGLDGP